MEPADTSGGTVGRIVSSVKIENVSEPDNSIRCDALVDAGAAHMVLPQAWKDRLGTLETMDRVDVETATQEIRQGTVCGPVRVQLEGFRPIYAEVLFLGMTPSHGAYEPLIGYLVLQQSQAAVDVLGHRLVRVCRVDLK